jgi:SAM-dependent methyltransferase
MKKLLNYIERSRSVVTGQENMEHLYTFENFPVFFGCTNQPEENDLAADMVWEIDPLTGMIQLTRLIPLDILYMEQHVDATGPTWAAYNNAFSEYLLKNRTGDILEIGGGSGKIANIVLEKDSTIHYTVVEPNPTFEERDNLKVIKAFFSKELRSQTGTNQTVAFSQVYEHVYNPEEFLGEINEFLAVGGRLVFAYPNLEHWFENKFTNAINFEHTMLMTDYFVDYFLKKTGFKIIEKLEYQKHSHFYTVEKVALTEKLAYTDLENKYVHYKTMFDDYISYHKNMVDEINENIRNTNSEIYLFGAHIFSQSLIAFGLDTSKIVTILDNSPLKQGKRLYGSSLMVKSPSVLSGTENPVIILKAGLYNREIQEDILNNINSTAQFI